RLHMNKHNRPYKCSFPGCGKGFTTSGSQRLHEGGVHQMHGEPLSCPHCPYKATRKDNLLKHIIRYH
ncbi:hypothetical protein K469DRAFT_500763, partial [Zopfia rhizophila CBS 207.26]